MFISLTKASTLPPTPSAITTAMSFAERTMSILIALSSVSSVPTLKPIFDGGCASAFAETLSSVLGASLCSRMAWKATYTVINFVTDAGYQGRPASDCAITRPLFASTRR